MASTRTSVSPARQGRSNEGGTGLRPLAGRRGGGLGRAVPGREPEGPDAAGQVAQSASVQDQANTGRSARPAPVRPDAANGPLQPAQDQASTVNSVQPSAAGRSPHPSAVQDQANTGNPPQPNTIGKSPHPSATQNQASTGNSVQPSATGKPPRPTPAPPNPTEEPTHPLPAPPDVTRRRAGWLAGAGIALVWLGLGWAGAEAGLWWTPLALGVLAGTLWTLTAPPTARHGWWCAAAGLLSAAGWALPLLRREIAGEPVLATAHTVASIAGMPGFASAVLAAAVLLPAAQGAAGVWAGSSVAAVVAGPRDPGS